MRFGITSLLVGVTLAAVVVRLAMWEPMLGGAAAAAWLGGVWSHVTSGRLPHGWLRGASAGLFWFAVSPLVIVTAAWMVVHLPTVLFGRDPEANTAIIAHVATWAPYVQSIASGIAGGLTGTWLAYRRDLEPADAR
jgi:hypothetical protein